ncbi:MAG: ATP-binding protein [Desulfobacula sp.]|nr:ATP-binding protein [Desulfobacula sp.]
MIPDDKSIFDVFQTKDSIRCSFASTFENIDDVCHRASQFLQSRVGGIDKSLFAINLVIREGLTNAVRHGNAGDSQKNVKFSLMVENCRIIKIAIEDQGDGFDWRKQQTIKPCDGDDHGRGFLIMATYFKRYTYNEKGNILYLEKDISKQSGYESEMK